MQSLIFIYRYHNERLSESLLAYIYIHTKSRSLPTVHSFAASLACKHLHAMRSDALEICSKYTRTCYTVKAPTNVISSVFMDHIHSFILKKPMLGENSLSVALCKKASNHHANLPLEMYSFTL